MIKRKKMISLLLVLTLVSGMFVQTYATEIDDTKKKAEELESKKKAAENEKTSGRSAEKADGRDGRN